MHKPSHGTPSCHARQDYHAEVEIRLGWYNVPIDEETCLNLFMFSPQYQVAENSGPTIASLERAGCPLAYRTNC